MRAARSAWVGLLAALAMMGAACSLAPPRVGEAPPVLPNSAHQKEYQAVLARYTAHQELYAKLETRMFVATTFQAWPMREARTRRRAEFQQQPLQVLEQNLTREKTEFDAAHEFFLAVSVVDYRYDDFDRASSIWRMVMITSKGEVTPSAVTRIGRSSLELRAYYPYFDDFWVAYKVAFPRTVDGVATLPDDDANVTLRISSTLGRADLVVQAR